MNKVEIGFFYYSSYFTGRNMVINQILIKLFGSSMGFLHVIGMHQ